MMVVQSHKMLKPNRICAILHF